jgi:hypothetical protein
MPDLRSSRVPGLVYILQKLQERGSAHDPLRGQIAFSRGMRSKFPFLNRSLITTIVVHTIVAYGDERRTSFGP